MTKQQEQTKLFFKGHAKDWQTKTEDELYSVINDRHRAAHKTISRHPKGSSLLDIGCGTGQLAIEASMDGYNSTGIDFADEMISIAKDNAKKLGSSACFEVASAFDYVPNKKFNVISAMGFIEYISLQQLDQFLHFSHQALAEDGSISIGSRNRMFNLTTFNEYTDLEISLGTVATLLEEASITMSSENLTEYLSKIRDFSKKVNLVQNDTHPLTGIGVQTRYQFTPSDLMRKVENTGFEVTNIYPINFHAFNPSLHSNNEIMLLEKNISELVSKSHQDNLKFLVNSSSFVLEAVKCR